MIALTDLQKLTLLASLEKRAHWAAWKSGLDGDDGVQAMAELIEREAAAYRADHHSGAQFETYLMSQLIKGWCKQQLALGRFGVELDEAGARFSGPESMIWLSMRGDDKELPLHRTAGDEEATPRLGVLPLLLRRIATLVLAGQSVEEIGGQVRLCARQVRNLMEVACSQLRARLAAAQGDLFAEGGQ